MDTKSAPKITINAVINKPNINTIKARTFTPSYDNSEDRIRLVINYSDYENRVDFWITRSFLLEFIPTVEEYLDRYDLPISNEPSDIKAKENHNIQISKSTQTVTDSSTLAVMEKDAILATKSEITHCKASNRFKLIIKSKHIAAEATLEAGVARAILRGIFSITPKIAWGISPSLLHD